MEQIIYRYNPWWEKDFNLEGIIKRPSALDILKKYLPYKQIIFLIGLRRVGKTTLFKILIKHLIDNGNIDPKYIFYISLDDYLISKRSIIEIVEEYRKIHKLSFKEKIFLFFDEIGYKENFELQLKNLYDSQNVKIFASSSSASILKSKKPFLTGRNIVVELLPLDFNEYLKFKQIKIRKGDEHLLEKYFEDYMQTGGLPEYVLKSDVEYIKEIVDDIIYKDIAAFYRIRNPQILKDYFLLLMERSGKAVSINKIAHILGISPDTSKRYLEMFSNTYLIYLLRRCGKTNEKIISPKKIYAADLGIRSFFTGFKDIGSLFENYVYLKIKNYNPCYIYKDNTEIDFLIENNTLIEVKYHSNMTEKQLKLFSEINASKKVVIHNIGELNNFLLKF